MGSELSLVIGTNVHRVREARMWSMEVAAAELGVAVAHLTAIERGAGALTLASLPELARRLRVPVKDLVTPPGHP